jgi:hypothetical protein
MTMLVALLLLAAQGAADAKREAVMKGLQDLGAGKGDLQTLTVTWDDLHGLHGGLKLTIKGDGTVAQEVVREKAGVPKDKVDATDLKALVDLLVRHEAWVQKVPERAPVPDESRARLVLTVGGASVTVWEWTNDLARNKRLVEVRDLMKKIAWK